MRKRHALTAFLTTALLGVGLTTPAHAATSEDAAGLNLYDNAACQGNWAASKFKLHLWYNSGQGGSFRNIGYSVYDFNALRPGDGHAHALKYCLFGASSPWPGSGQNIKNNAASGENTHSKYMARIYYYSGYKKPYQTMGAYQQIDRFTTVYNENASFAWIQP